MYGIFRHLLFFALFIHGLVCHIKTVVFILGGGGVAEVAVDLKSSPSTLSAKIGISGVYGV